jgi:hypothetical protein
LSDVEQRRSDRLRVMRAVYALRHGRRHVRPESRLGDEHQAVTIAEVVDLIELGTAIDAPRHRPPHSSGAVPHAPHVVIQVRDSVREEVDQDAGQAAEHRDG